MSNEELAERAKAGDQAALAELWTNNQGIIHKQVMKYRGLIEEADGIQEAFFALVKAVDGYKPEAGAKFITYLTIHLDGHLQRIIARDSTLSVNKHELVTRYRQAVAKFESEHGRTPTDQEAADLLNISPEALEKVKAADLADTPASLDAPTRNEDGDALTLADTVEDRTTDPEAEAIEDEYQRELAGVLWQTVDELPEDQADTLRKRYRDGLTLKETSERQGRTVNATAGTERKALLEMRRPRRARKIRPFYDEIFTRALRGEGVGSFEMTWTSSTEREGIRLYRRERGEDEDESGEETARG